MQEHSCRARTVSQAASQAASSGTISSVAKVGQNLNANSAVSKFGIYEILKDGQLYKYGKADLTRITQSTGLPTRLHQQLRVLGNKFPNSNFTGEVIDDLGKVTTGAAKNIENNYIGNFLNNTGSVPLGNVKSFNVLKWLGY